MWLSKEIERQDDIKDALRDLAKMIKKYKDTTLLDKDAGFGEKFFSADLGRWFRPRWWVFVGLTLGFGILGMCYCWILDADVLKGWATMNITIVVSVFVLGVSLSTLARNASESGRFAAEYLHDSCRIVLVESMSLLALMLSVVAVIFTNSLWLWLKAGLVTASIGAMIWTVLSFAFVIIEVVRVTVPKYSTLAAATYASRKLCHAYLKQVYLSVCMGKYTDLLKSFCEILEAIHSPNEYWSRRPGYGKDMKDAEISEQEVELPFSIDFHLGFRDYNLAKLRNLDRILHKENSELFLIPHGMEPKKAGRQFITKSKSEKIVQKTRRSVLKWCRFKRDRFAEEDFDFWNENFWSLRKSLNRALYKEDVDHFKKYLSAIETAFEALRKSRKNKRVRDYFGDGSYEINRFIFLYKIVLKDMLLEHKRKERPYSKELIIDYLRLLQGSIWKQVESEFEHGDTYMLNIFKWLIPSIYKEFEKEDIHKEPELWEMRAKFGSFYAYTNMLFEKHKLSIDKNNNEVMRIVLHEGLTKWLLVAIESKDDELVKSLCEASRKLVFPDGFIVLKSEKLILRHLVLCGHMLQLIIQKKFTDTESIKKMLFKDYTPLNIDFGGLADFYKENQFPGEKVRDYVRDMFYDDDWSAQSSDLLTGIGAGRARFISDGHNELGYTFVYLALLALRTCREPEPTPADFVLAHLEDKADKLCEREIARELDISSTRTICQVFKNWLQGCKDAIDKAEERRIAAASLVPELTNEYKKGFWEGYGKRNTFLDLCIEHGYFSIDESAETKLYDRAPKQVFIDNDLGTLALGTRQGEELGRFARKDVLKKITDIENDNKKTVANIADMFSNSAEWFSQRGCTKRDGLLVVRSNKMLEILLGNDELYRPGWREGEGCRFNGFYKDFPIIYIREKDKRTQCSAIDFREWKGLCVRSELVTKKKYGELEIKTWTDEEISDAINNDKLKEDQRDQAKGNCPIKVTLFWKWDEEKKPVMQTIVLGDNAQV